MANKKKLDMLARDLAGLKAHTPYLIYSGEAKGNKMVAKGSARKSGKRGPGRPRKSRGVKGKTPKCKKSSFRGKILTTAEFKKLAPGSKAHVRVKGGCVRHVHKKANGQWKFLKSSSKKSSAKKSPAKKKSARQSVRTMTSKRRGPGRPRKSQAKRSSKR